MKPRGRCPKGGKHDLDEKIKAIGLAHPDGKLEPIAGLPKEKYWYCKKCKGAWKR